MTRNATILRPMNVAGMMSGTSADGIDVAIVRIAPGAKGLRMKLLAHHAVPFSTSVRAAVLAAMDAGNISTAELARLNWRLGIAYADAIKATLAEYPVKLQLIGCHGQTIYHQGVPAKYAGVKLACTWQIGEMAMLAAASGVPVVSNFRPADMVAGGQGAPLVSLLDFVMFRHAGRGRVLQNLGGIGNLTAMPAGASLNDLIAFDTGPANMLIDAVTQSLFGKPFDRRGAIAARGMVLEAVVVSALKHPFFGRKPPKSAGREEFGSSFAAQFLKQCKAASRRPEDAVATATALTARSIGLAYCRFVQDRMEGAVDYLLSGGGAHNATLVEMLSSELDPLGCKLGTTEDAGLPAQTKEAAAFGLLAYETWHRRPGNVPAATGAVRSAILGEITYA
ncbi:Anhydro-N-acetylmuramic acid kinase [Acidisarcina polymorpha]|uniref:Anhydro-N-acetylmuramic acid kinase n=1 Tax=Acidisarcina polymorpha TaxID=2211140 RepID=A0A2Z5G702_9BACT|nr:anhydro-N-acetylmuramic acid kinase [Acidisarcina polymorpha]AXC15053.1 Anhydro-N-acetylmuramic acid kinase [Acidisarcina polymorpha]